MTRRTPEEEAVREQAAAGNGADDGAAASEAAGAADGENGKPEREQSEAAAEQVDTEVVESEAAEPEVVQPEPADAEVVEPEVVEAEAAPADTVEPEPDPEPDPLTKAQAERDEYLELARRSQADFENYRKRVAKDVASAGERAKIGLVRDLLPVVDNLERALASAENGDAGVAQGVGLVLTDLQGVLTREGVVALEPTGDAFDPTVHEALSTREQEGAEPGIVLDVVEKGYRMSDTVIRPARVVVSA
ncbi:MAG: molecular chaperone GrpE [Thermoleophilaceae bacterium]|nr:molecular chaperone GrpE [Thermoleophilaceae bacterium]